MRELKKAFEARHAGVTIDAHVRRVARPRGPHPQGRDPATSSRRRRRRSSSRISWARRSPAADRDAATWYVVFSANEMVVITAKGNPLGFRQVADLARPDVKFVRITGEKDLATGRTIEFVKRATAQEGEPELAQAIIDRAPVRSGEADRRSRRRRRRASEGRANAASSTTRQRSPRAPTSTPSAFPPAST